MEQKLLASLAKDRTHFDDIERSLEEGDLSPHGWKLFEKIGEFYKTDRTAKSADMDIIIDRLARELDNPKHLDAFKTLIKSFPQDVSGINVVKEFIDTKRYNAGLRLSHALAGGNEDVEDLLEEYRKYQDLKELTYEKPYEVVVGRMVEDLAPSFSNDNLIPLYPFGLNDRIGGGLIGGDHMLLFGRPEVGKTANALTFIRRPAERGIPVLYLGNEDSLERVLQRALCSFAGITWEEALKNPGNANKLALEHGYGNVVFVSATPGTINEINDLVSEYKPKLLVLDQVGNIQAKADNKTLQLGHVMQSVRNIAKKNDLAAISLWQAGDSGSNKLVLDMEDLNWSNTDMQAACDIIVGVGMDKEFEAKDQRMYSLCKNKSTGDHSFFPVRINRQISRVSSI
jgi:replicative DNA helicase